MLESSSTIPKFHGRDRIRLKATKEVGTRPFSGSFVILTPFCKRDRNLSDRYVVSR